MAKSKRSRRIRVTKVDVEELSSPEPAAQEADGASFQESATADWREFARDYYYVYTELRSIILIGIIMFGVMLGLAFFV